MALISKIVEFSIFIACHCHFLHAARESTPQSPWHRAIVNCRNKENLYTVIRSSHVGKGSTYYRAIFLTFNQLLTLQRRKTATEWAKFPSQVAAYWTMISTRWAAREVQRLNLRAIEWRKLGSRSTLKKRRTQRYLTWKSTKNLVYFFLRLDVVWKFQESLDCCPEIGSVGVNQSVAQL